MRAEVRQMADGLEIVLDERQGLQTDAWWNRHADAFEKAEEVVVKVHAINPDSFFWDQIGHLRENGCHVRIIALSKLAYTVIHAQHQVCPQFEYELAPEASAST